MTPAGQLCPPRGALDRRGPLRQPGPAEEGSRDPGAHGFHVEKTPISAPGLLARLRVLDSPKQIRPTCCPGSSGLTTWESLAMFWATKTP